MREARPQPATPKSLKFLYNTAFGSLVLRLITRRWLSKLAGKYMSSRLSKRKIKKYIKKYGIDMSCFIEEEYKCFNAFFTRRIKPELRPFDMDGDAFLSPCDGLVSAYNIEPGLKFNVKGFDYDLNTLLRDEELASRYDGGLCIVFRLTVTDYHRYFFTDGGTARGNKFIKGRLHTVQPAALQKKRVFTENCREVTVLDTDHFGTMTQVEVGAMMVGRISNAVKEGRFERGDEKGWFDFGGSTIILLVEKDKVALDEEFIENTKNDLETVVKCGETIGRSPEAQAADLQAAEETSV
ncbi:MAG: phosphatidylserine decarboxylase [Clostridiales bacterium]|nr:phosphatidylserine decarboxylase [Clostridiales bacterium]